MRSFIVVFMALLGTTACTSRCPPNADGTANCLDTSPQQHLASPTNPTFTLFVSNQSFELDPVDVRIEIDDQLAITGDFVVGSQHTWAKFDFGLAPGGHDIVVTTSDINATLAMPFSMDDRKYAVVNFWYSPVSSSEPTPPQFSFTLSDDPPTFL